MIRGTIFLENIEVKKKYMEKPISFSPFPAPKQPIPLRTKHQARHFIPSLPQKCLKHLVNNK